MDLAKAVKIKNQILALCKLHGLWVEVKEASKPDLKDIVITVSLRIMEK